MMVDQCLVCGSERLVDKGRAASSTRRGYDRFSIVECRNCSLSFSDPLPSPSDIKAFYEREEPYEGVYGDADRQWQREQHRLDLLRLSQARGGRTGRLLDVGCSYGLLLEVAGSLGWEVHGIEPGEEAVERARARVGSARVAVGQLEDTPESWGDFDAISMSHVFEHFVDFRSALRFAAGRLTSGGILAIQTPNRRCLWTLGRGPDYRPIEHPYYWTYRSVSKALRYANLDPRPVPVLWSALASSGVRSTLKGAAMALERLLGPGANFGLKSTLEVHGAKR